MWLAVGNKEINYETNMGFNSHSISSILLSICHSFYSFTLYSPHCRTLALIRTARGLFAVGADQEWRHSMSPFGGPDAFCVR